MFLDALDHDSTKNAISRTRVSPARPAMEGLVEFVSVFGAAWEDLTSQSLGVQPAGSPEFRKSQAVGGELEVEQVVELSSVLFRGNWI